MWYCHFTQGHHPWQPCVELAWRSMMQVCRVHTAVAHGSSSLLSFVLKCGVQYVLFCRRPHLPAGGGCCMWTGDQEGCRHRGDSGL